MIYEVKRNNSSSLYDFFVNKGYSKSKDEFDVELFDLKENGENKYITSKTFVAEENNKVVAFIQYGRTKDNKGLIRLIYSEVNYESIAKSLMFKATAYFYMFHIFDIEIFVEQFKIGNNYEGVIRYPNIENLRNNNLFNLLKTFKVLNLSF